LKILLGGAKPPKHRALRR